MANQLAVQRVINGNQIATLITKVRDSFNSNQLFPKYTSSAFYKLPYFNYYNYAFRKNFLYDKLIYVYYQNNSELDGAILIFDKNKEYALNYLSTYCQLCKSLFSEDEMKLMVKVNTEVNINNIAAGSSIQEKLIEQRLDQKRKN